MPTGFSWSELEVDAARVRTLNDAPLPSRRRYVLYWCLTTHRAEANHALDAALALGNHLRLPVVCYHPFGTRYLHASDRIHRFVLEGMADMARGLRRRGIPYWVELPRQGGGSALPKLARHSA